LPRTLLSSPSFSHLSKQIERVDFRPLFIR
jgi:hypothetical protein